jgi:hypothetical protein
MLRTRLTMVMLVLATLPPAPGCDGGGGGRDADVGTEDVLPDGSDAETDAPPDTPDGTDADADLDADLDVPDDGPPPVHPGCTVPPAGPGDPELPRVSIDTTYTPPGGAEVTLGAGGDLQAAIDAAAPGDLILLEPGASFTGNFRLRAKAGEEWIVVRSAAADGDLPPEHARARPDNLAHMPSIVTPNDMPAVETDDGAHHYRFIGIDFRPADGVSVNAMVSLGSGSATDAAQLAHDIIIDRCIVRGDPAAGGKRGVQLNSGAAAVVDSTFLDWKREGQDTQAIGGWNGTGPYRIVNNYLEGAGENVMFGGADAVIPDVIPSDIEICGNHFTKPLAWKQDEPGYEGTHWSVKNLFELKVGRRILVAGNVFEQCWADAQTGFAILIKSANQDGGQPWAVTEHVTFAYNIVRSAGHGINVSRTDGGSLGTNNIRFYGNLVHDIGDPRWLSDQGRLYQVLSGVAAVTFDHNTGFGTTHTVVFDGTPPNDLFRFTNNIAGPTTYGIFGSGEGEGTAALEAYTTGAVVEANVLVGEDEASYPAGNFFPAAVSDVGFVDEGADDYRLAPTSPYASAATDGTAVGADIDALLEATAGAVL